MGSWSSIFLQGPAQQAVGRIYATARQHRKMGAATAAAYTVLALLAYTLLRLESPSWQAWRRSYGPWFAHLTQRRYYPADLLRYALQGLWLLCVRLPEDRAAPWAIWPRLRRLAAGVAVARGKLVDALGARLKPAVYQSSVRRALLPSQGDWLGVLSARLRLMLFAALALVVALLTALTVTQPFSLLAQCVFVALLWCVAVSVRNIRGRFSSLILIVLSLIVSARYVWWRYTETLNWNNNLDLFFGLTLLAAETYSWIVLVLGYIQTAWPLHRGLAPLPADTREWPVVDLMIPTYDEGLDVVKATVYAALGMDWPKDKLRIHLLDDGRREEFRVFAGRVGIGYIVRADGRHAKAGNLNNALRQTDGELIAVFDCDHIPTRAFLQMTVGWFFKDKKLALVQTPHHFFSPDPFERNLGHFGTQPNENTLFYGLVQDGNDLWNAAFFCGSCAVLRRSALDEIGGFAVETVTEDAHTALRLHRHGYNSAYLRIPMAAGLATESLSAHIGQRTRWARGMVQIFRMDNPLFGKGLSFFQRVCYVNAMMHFLAGVPRLVYLLAPLAFLLAHSYIVYAPALTILLYVLPHIAHASLTNSYMQGSYRRAFWGEIYETVLAWYIARPTTVALFAPSKGAFNVTAKGGLIAEGFFDWKIALPYIFLALANFLGLVFGVWRLWAGPPDEAMTVIITMSWVFYNLVVLGGAVAVAAEIKQTRNSHRVSTALPAALQVAEGQAYSGVVTNYSDGGVAISLTEFQTITTGQEVSVLLARGERQFAFPGRVSRNIEGNVGVHFYDLSQQQHIDFVQCTFARADAWVAQRPNFALDRPLQSLMDVVLLGLSGYRRMADFLPARLSRAMLMTVNAVTWSLSFLPRSYPAENYRHALV